MLHKISKKDRAERFRQRLGAAMREREMTQSALARAAGVDRSTISQLLGGDQPRLPNAQLIGDFACALRVSTDWLLGLSDRPESAADLLDAELKLTDAPRAMIDETIFDWHREASGYKIRHVPAGLPDMLKTDAMMAWEYAPNLGRSSRQAIGAGRDRLDWIRSSASDYEIALPCSEIETFARAQGHYAGIPEDVRLAQMDHLVTLHDQLYPRLRLFLFDTRQVFSAPLTVFGPLLAVLHLGQHYMAFRDRERVAALARDFDRLVRHASVSDRDFPAHLASLRNGA